MQVLSGTVGDGAFRASLASLESLREVHVIASTPEAAVEAITSSVLAGYAAVEARSVTLAHVLGDGVAAALKEQLFAHATLSATGPCGTRMRGTLRTDGTLVLGLARELYQRLGVDGPRVAREGKRRRTGATQWAAPEDMAGGMAVRTVSVPLSGDGRVRRRMAACASMPSARVPPVDVRFVVSAESAALLAAALPQGSSVRTLRPTLIRVLHDAPLPPLVDIAEAEAADEDALCDSCEELCLCVGALVRMPGLLVSAIGATTCSSAHCSDTHCPPADVPRETLRFVAPPKTDAFVSTCVLAPAARGTATHIAIAEDHIPPGVFADLVAALSASGNVLVCASAADGRCAVVQLSSDRYVLVLS